MRFMLLKIMKLDLRKVGMTYLDCTYNCVTTTYNLHDNLENIILLLLQIVALPVVDI